MWVSIVIAKRAMEQFCFVIFANDMTELKFYDWKTRNRLVDFDATLFDTSSMEDDGGWVRGGGNKRNLGC